MNRLIPLARRSFHVPVITPYELELGLGAMEWNSRFLVNSSK
jgi:diphthamide synthase subunit DPH2